MIKQITEGTLNFSDSWYGRKIQAYITAYGLRYDFCRLYVSDKGGMILVYNSTMTCDGEFDEGELEGFVSMLSPVTLELSECRLKPDGYNAYRRTMFKGVTSETDVKAEQIIANCRLNDVYEILEESFGLKEYEAWYADMSHRIRHGVSEVFLCGSTTATKLFDIDGFVFLSHIATGKADRGKGRARQLMYFLCNEFEKQGKSVYLYAKDERVSFYEEIGFKPVSSDIFYEKGV